MEHHFEIMFVTRLFLMLVTERFMRVFFDKRRTGFPVIALSYLAFPLGLTAITALFLFLGELPAILAIILSVAPPVALLYVIALNYEGTWKKRLVAAFSIFAIGIAINYALAIVFGAYLRAIYDFAPRQSDVHFLFEMIASLLLSLMVALLLQNFKHIRKSTAVLPAVWVSVVAIPLASIAVLFLIAFADGISAPVQIFIICVMFGISAFVFYLLDRISASHAARLEAALHAQEKDYYAEQCRLMQESMGQMKSIRHDIKLHLAAINGFTAEYNAVKIRDYIAGLLDGISGAETYSDTGNTAIDSIINYKLKNAKQENINLDIRLLVPPDISIEASDLTAILGNLLDNALAATAAVPEKKIKLDIEYSRQTLFIKVENTFDGVVRYAAESAGGEKGIAGGFASRKTGGEHGQGLANIARAVEKYNGSLRITHDGGIFAVTVLLFTE